MGIGGISRYGHWLAYAEVLETARYGHWLAYAQVLEAYQDMATSHPMHMVVTEEGD
jgi:hypothetical protein